MGLFQFIAKTIAPEEFNAPNSTLRQATEGLERAAVAIVSTSAISGAVATVAQATANLGNVGVTGGATVNPANVTGANAYQPAQTPVLKTPQQGQALPTR